jgi:predicted phage-related endonuclease
MTTLWTKSTADRRYFIGGSDARIIMGDEEAALLRLWREKRGEVELEDLSGNLIVQLGLITEPLNRHWFERSTDQAAVKFQRLIGRPVNRWMGAEKSRWLSWVTTKAPCSACG